jgi:hypothetical protein
MHAVVGGDLIGTAHTLDRFQRHFALESRAVLFPLFAHRSSAKVPIYILFTCPVFGEWLTSLFVLYRLWVEQKDATINLLKEKNQWLEDQLKLAEQSKPDVLLELKEKRLKATQEELIQLSRDYEKNSVVISRREEERNSLLIEIAELKTLIDVCPHCGAALQELGYIEETSPQVGNFKKYRCEYHVETSFDGSDRIAYCPSEPEFQQSMFEKTQWFITIWPKTEKLGPAKFFEVFGETQEEVDQNLEKQYYYKGPFDKTIPTFTLLPIRARKI